MFACGVEGEENATAESAVEGVLSQTFSGKVVDGGGTPISGARITINGISRITSSTGQYAVSVADSPNGYRVDIRKDGYGPLTALKLAGALSQVHRLTAATPRIIEPTRPNTITDPASGIKVDIPANSLRGSGGALPAGQVRFTIIPHSSQTMPGDFTAQNAGGTRVALISVGAVTLQAQDAQGNTLGLAPGASLLVNLPVPASAGGTMPACVLNGTCRTAMWRFDPATQLWVENLNATPAFGTAGTQFAVRGQREGGLIDPADGLGTWNADIEFNVPACVVIEFSNIPLDCFNPPPISSPEPGIEVTFTQALAGGGTKSKTSAVASSAAFLVLYNLRPNVDVDLDFAFPPGAPANCRNNLSFTSTPAANPGFPILTPGGGATQVSSGAPWGGTGYPTDGGGSPIDLLDVVGNTHPCNSKVTVTTF